MSQGSVANAGHTSAEHHSLHREAHRAPELYNDDLLNSSTSGVPEPLYRLRVSVLKDAEGSADCPVRMFIFPSQGSLSTAVKNLTSVFAGAFSEYKITSQGGALLPAIRPLSNSDDISIPEQLGVEDGRTEDVQIEFDSQTADESWREFLVRMDRLKKGWGVEELGVRSLRGGGVEAKKVGGVWKGEE